MTHRDQQPSPADLGFASSYDLLPYPRHSFRHTHPDHLATLARLLGQQPAPPEQCRVLELGCASGGNLLPMAFYLPESRFVGIDLSACQIGEGRALAAEVGLPNLELRQGDLTELGPEWGRFDYILCHGVFSWVPPAVRRRILEICRDHLTEAGLAYVSYNCWPGWLDSRLVRELLLRRVDRSQSPPAQASQARQILNFFLQVAEEREDPRLPALRKEQERWKHASNSYLFHEYLAEVNELFTLEQVVDQAADCGLQYVGDAWYQTMMLDNQPARLAEYLGSCRSAVDAQQQLDLFTHRRFRGSIFCHAGQRVESELSGARAKPLQVRATFTGDPLAGPLDETTAISLTNELEQTATISSPALRIALDGLLRAAPAAVPFTTLAETVEQRLIELGSWDPRTEVAARAALHDDLAWQLTRLHFALFVKFHVWQPPIATRIAECPCAAWLSRLEAQLLDRVTNPWHGTVFLNEVERQLLLRLDGTRTSEELAQELPGYPDPAAARTPVMSGLQRLREMALLLEGERWRGPGT